MFKQLADWLDDRTGYRDLMKEALDEPIPGGARWRYVFGSALTVVFMVQVFTGLLLDDVVQPVVVDGLGERLLHQPRDVGGLVHPRRPPLRRAGDGRAPGPAPAPGPLGRRLSPAARAQLVVRHGPPVPDARLQPDRLPAPLGPEGLLGDQGRDQHHGRSARSPGPTSRRSWSAAPTTATRRSRGSTACTSASCRPCSSSAWRRTSPCSGATASRRRRTPRNGPTATFWPEQLFMDTRLQRGRRRRRDRPGAGRGGGQSRRPGRSRPAPTTRRGRSGTSSRSSRCSSSSRAAARSSARS